MLTILALLAFFAIALPDAMLGIAWPYMSATFHLPLAAMTLVLPFGVAATLVSTSGWTWAAARFGLGRVLTGSIAFSTVALLASALAPGYWVILICAVVFGLSAGAVDAALNAYAARHFGPRLINVMHAAYGIGAATSPLAVTAIVSTGANWRWAYFAVMLIQGALAILFAANARRWTDPASSNTRARLVTPAKPRGIHGLRGLPRPAAAGLVTVAVERAAWRPRLAFGRSSTYSTRWRCQPQPRELWSPATGLRWSSVACCSALWRSGSGPGRSLLPRPAC